MLDDVRAALTGFTDFLTGNVPFEFAATFVAALIFAALTSFIYNK